LRGDAHAARTAQKQVLQPAWNAIGKAMKLIVICGQPTGKSDLAIAVASFGAKSHAIRCTYKGMISNSQTVVQERVESRITCSMS
jgi:hypothetical protein